MINYSIVMRSVNANLLEINRRQKRLDLFDADFEIRLKRIYFPLRLNIFSLKAKFIFP
jgi:hypothetical protein